MLATAIIVTIFAFSILVFTIYLLIKIRRERLRQETKIRKWTEDGIDWYEESGSIDPETFNRLKTKNGL